MSKHTKGPWDLQRPMFGEQHIYVNSENSVDGKAGSGRQHICVLPYEGKGGGAAYREMFNANAKLISAAPDMFEALQDALSELEFLKNAPDSAYARPDDETIKAVRDALTKAGFEA